VTDSCEHGTESSDCTIGGEFLDDLSEGGLCPVDLVRIAKHDWKPHRLPPPIGLLY
jgi:hypothetical protein